MTWSHGSHSIISPLQVTAIDLASQEENQNSSVVQTLKDLINRLKELETWSILEEKSTLLRFAGCVQSLYLTFFPSLSQTVV